MIRSHSNFLSKRPHCVPGTLLSSLCVLYHLILTTALLVRTVEVFTDEESEAEVRQLALSHTVSHWWSQDSSLARCML